MIYAIGFCFNLAIEIASRIDSSSAIPIIILFLAASLGISYYPKAQNMVYENKSGFLSSFLSVWAFLQFAEINI